MAISVAIRCSLRFEGKGPDGLGFTELSCGRGAFDGQLAAAGFQRSGQRARGQLDGFSFWVALIGCPAPMMKPPSAPG